MSKRKALRIGLPLLIVMVSCMAVISIVWIVGYNSLEQLNMPNIMPHANVLVVLGGVIALVGGIIYVKAGLVGSRKSFILLAVVNNLYIIYIITVLIINCLPLSLLVILAIIVLDMIITADEKLGGYSWVYFVGFVLKVYILVLNYAIVMLN